MVLFLPAEYFMVYKIILPTGIFIFSHTKASGDGEVLFQHHIYEKSHSARKHALTQALSKSVEL